MFESIQNPTNEILAIENLGEIKCIEIFDRCGKMILKTVNPSTNSIDLCSLKNGVYFLKLRGDTLELTKKVIK